MCLTHAPDIPTDEYVEGPRWKKKRQISNRMANVYIDRGSMETRHGSRNTTSALQRRRADKCRDPRKKMRVSSLYFFLKVRWSGACQSLWSLKCVRCVAVPPMRLHHLHELHMWNMLSSSCFFFFHRGLPVRHREGCNGERWSFFPRGVWTLGTIFVFCFPFNMGKRWPFFPGGLLDVRKHLFPT